MRIAFECGAQQITGGSIAVKNPEIFSQWLARYGTDKIILGADVKEIIATDGWLKPPINRSLLLTLSKEGVKTIICTDISKDGMLQGPSFELCKNYCKTQLNLVASGGISQYDELPKLAEMGCDGTIIGKAIYENRISLKQLEEFILSH